MANPTGAAAPLLYTAEVDYGAEHRPAFSRWFASRHAPDLLRAGFASAASYRALVGGLAVLNVYELHDAAVFSTPAYQSMSAKDPYGTTVRATSAGQQRAQTVYRQLAVAVDAADAHATPSPIDADWLSLVRFATPEGGDDDWLGWFETDMRPHLTEWGAKRSRAATRTADVVGAGTHRPRCLILIEWAARPPGEADRLVTMLGRLGGVTAVEPYLGYRAYPWPDSGDTKVDGLGPQAG